MITIEGELTTKTEDGGQAMIGEFDDTKTKETGTDGMLFVRIQSWHERGTTHPVLSKLNGRRVRVTIEVVG